MDQPRLLVVDDDSYTRFALHAIFSRQGWHVAVARTVAEGMARLSPPPHCLILDLNLPDGDGESILREVREKHPRTRVAVCSGTGDPSRLAAVRGLNPELMLFKPIEMAPVFQLCDAARSAST